MCSAKPSTTGNAFFHVLSEVRRCQWIQPSPLRHFCSKKNDQPDPIWSLTPSLARCMKAGKFLTFLRLKCSKNCYFSSLFKNKTPFWKRKWNNTFRILFQGEINFLTAMLTNCLDLPLNVEIIGSAPLDIL